MIIAVTFQDNRWTIAPDPAVVSVGEPIMWIVRWAHSDFSTLRWFTYFEHGAPFAARMLLMGPGSAISEEPFGFERTIRLGVTTRNTRLGTILNRIPNLASMLQREGATVVDIADHQGVVGPVRAEEPGEYKYGVRVLDGDTGEPLGDDDPRLIVRPRY